MADIGSKLLPHLFIVLTEDAVRVDAFGKGDKLLIGNIVLNMIRSSVMLSTGETNARVSRAASTAAASMSATQLSTMAGRVES